MILKACCIVYLIRLPSTSPGQAILSVGFLQLPIRIRPGLFESDGILPGRMDLGSASYSKASTSPYKVKLPILRRSETEKKTKNSEIIQV